MRKKKVRDWDDGRVIAPMNIDGMPWYRHSRYGNPRDRNAQGDAGLQGGGVGQNGTEGVLQVGAQQRLTRGESIAFAFGVLKAVLLIALVFAGVLFAFILFCTNVWLR